MADGIIAFKYLGGKFSKREFILPLLIPRARKVAHFAEGFCGSASITLNRRKTCAETINDLNDDIITFFRVLRDQPDELIHKLRLSPYARKEYEENCRRNGDGDWSDLPDLEHARMFFMHIWQSYGGMPAKPSTWVRSIAANQNSQQDRPARVNRVIEELFMVAERLKGVTVESVDVFRFLEKYGDDEGALIYLDPPYPDKAQKSNSGYRKKGFGSGTDDFHEKLLTTCLGMKAAFAISTYPNDIYSSLLGDWHLHTRDFASQLAGGAGVKGKGGVRTEALFTNYEPAVEKPGALY